ncbi:NAD(P)-dependent oxidoreductase [Limnovirga soli]|uniref:Saccharopine dehydrogenase [NAD(+), L-lysine-forming] n=1 Tax=Limnovirga soli TaxID=2656915 RepID=A0A8J8FH35_9BACT|nr:NAD(P)-dependent oxidoreductase [Limnovirga soli]NNV54954.1 alanine dehydrogenase [Limnovirga soli]
MLVIGLIREGKIPADNRVALTPAQCKWIQKNSTNISIFAQPSNNRSFTNKEYEQAGVILKEDLSNCDMLLGIKEVPVHMLIPNKTYLFFSHTKKKQPYNQGLMHAMMDRNITLIDYECLEHADGQRIIGFGFFAGIVGAHNGIMAYGNRTGEFSLGRVHKSKDYRELIHTYFGLKLPNIKVAVTGSGRVAHGIIEVMNLMDVQEVEPDEYLQKQFSYPVYTHLKGADLYRHKETGQYKREHFHENAADYDCLFEPFCSETDVLMNGIYWDKAAPRLFEMEALHSPAFRIQSIADITDDAFGSVPCNLGDATIDDPIYGVDRLTGVKTAPYLPGSIDVMAVGNLPNELPRDASRFFGEQLIKHILPDLLGNGSVVIDRATILKNGSLTPHFNYLTDYAAH